MSIPISQLDKQGQLNQLLQRQQCTRCPFKPFKLHQDGTEPDEIDIIVLSEPTSSLVTIASTGVPTYHAFTTECRGNVKPEQVEAAQQCCWGRKLDLITKMRPKLVVTIGWIPFKMIEASLGHDSPNNLPYGALYPSQLKEHKFWLLPILDRVDLQKRSLPMVKQALIAPVPVEKPSTQGIELIMTSRQAELAFADLIKNPINALDIETSSKHSIKECRIRPYHSSSKLLTVAIGTRTKTYAFPIHHPQKPTSIDTSLILNLMTELAKQVPTIFHYGTFEMEWLAHFLGVKYLYSGQFEDTAIQANLLGGNKGLNSRIRKYFGFNLKGLSRINVETLEQTPLEKVLLYNSLDTKYTHALWEAQRLEIIREQLELIYQMQLERMPSTVLMQHIGAMPNLEFIQAETLYRKDNLRKLLMEFRNNPEVQSYLKTHNQCNPLSPDDVKALHYSLGVAQDITSFDEPCLAQMPYESSKLILKIRDENKIYGTYLAPNNPMDNHPNAGIHIWQDGRIHYQYNMFGAVTGRYSATFPAIQTFPSHGGLKYIRNVIRVPDLHVLLSADFGQLEYRIIAALSVDKEMVKAILEGLDVHAWWATRLMEMYPGRFVLETNQKCKKGDPDFKGGICPCYKCQFKEFRNKCKNQLVFPLCFGSSANNVAKSLGLSEQDGAKIGKEFWDKHHGVKKWQDGLRRQYDEQHYISNYFGRRYYAPIAPTEIINYPIQGTASDLVVLGQSKLSRMAVETDCMWLAPFINEHDSLSFSIPEEHVEEAVPIIIKTMLDTNDLGFAVPFLLEPEIGTTLGNLKPLGTFDSSKIGF